MCTYLGATLNSFCTLLAIEAENTTQLSTLCSQPFHSLLLFSPRLEADARARRERELDVTTQELGGVRSNLSEAEQAAEDAIARELALQAQRAKLAAQKDELQVDYEARMAHLQRLLDEQAEEAERARLEEQRQTRIRERKGQRGS